MCRPLKLLLWGLEKKKVFLVKRVGGELFMGEVSPKKCLKEVSEEFSENLTQDQQVLGLCGGKEFQHAPVRYRQRFIEESSYTLR